MSLKQAFLTPKQVRAGRALLAWSQGDLAKKAGVGPSTVADFERGHRTPVPNNADAMRRALEEAGISFPAGGAVSGPPLPGLGQRTQGGMPIRFVDISDLTHWANRRDAQSSLPTLISKLARACGPVTIHFPSDEGVQYAGWDGITISPVAFDYVPKGVAGWEIGTQREDIRRKANDDYTKRTADPGPLIVAAQSTFIFVTPRLWPGKNGWVAEKRKEGKWKDVRAYDGTDLVHWIESQPAVGQWLAMHLGKRPPGILQLEEVWREWSLATERPLTPELVLSDRDKEAADLLQWLRNDPATLALQAETRDEVAAFAYAAVNQLPPEIAGHYLARCLVATEPAAARALSDSESPLIIVLLEPEPGLSESIAQKGHHVLMAYGTHADYRGRLRKLERPSRDGIKAALIESGVEEREAKKYAREAYRSLGILRRLLPSRVSRIPEWAKSAPPRPLIAALLAGAWDERSDADKAILSRLADMDYDEIAAAITPYTGHLESPLRKVGSTWKIASPQDAWLLLAPYLSTPDIDRFEKVVLDVLGASDPRYELDAKERWYASLNNIKPAYSEYLRQGLSEILIMLALFGEHAKIVQNATGRPEIIVRTLLDGADAERWWSLSEDFRLLAEAAPTTFLDAIDHSLDEQDPPVKVLFAEEETPMATSEQHLAELLWALESLGWSPKYLSRVSSVLARLDAIDNVKSKWTNRPLASLRQMFVFWLPQTFATTNERERVLDKLRKDHPVQAWNLMMGILPGHHDTLNPAYETRWRDFSPETKEKPTWAGVNQLIENLFTDVGTNAKKWETLLDRLSSFPDRKRVIKQLENAVAQINDQEDRERLWHDLRKILHHNREFSDAQWALPEDELAELQVIYDSLEPRDPLARYGWIFDYGAALPDPAGDWQENTSQLELTRNRLAPKLLSKHGPDLIFTIARQVENARDLGFALVAGGVHDAELAQLLERSLKSQDAKERSLGYGLVAMKFHKGPADRKFVEDLLDRALAEDWGMEAVQTVLSALPGDTWAWNLAHKAGETIEREYWKRVDTFKLNLPDNDICAALEHLANAGRARAATHLAGHLMRGGKIPSELLIWLLAESLKQPFNKDHDRNEPTMFQHYVGEILMHLDHDPKIDRNVMLGLEWGYLPILEYSKRPPKVIMEELARNPELFVQLVSAIWGPSKESGYVDEEPQVPVHAEKLASHAYRLLSRWSIIPGTQPDGTIDAKELEDWVNQARKLANEKGRLHPADSRIGEVLSASPVGEDGIWPALPVRDLIERGVRSKRLETGFDIGRRNRRGVTVRLPRDGGQQERDEASWYREMAQKTNVEWPRLSGILEDIAKSYEHDAGSFDDDVERLDW